MKEKIERALQIFKAISEAIDSEQCRGRIVTFEDVNEMPFAEVFVVYDGTAIQRIEIEDNGKLFGKKVDSEEQAIMGIKMMCDAVISRIEDETSLTDEQREAITKSVEKHMTI